MWFQEGKWIRTEQWRQEDHFGGMCCSSSSTQVVDKWHNGERVLTGHAVAYKAPFLHREQATAHWSGFQAV